MKFSIIFFLPTVMAAALPADPSLADTEIWCACIAEGKDYPDSYSTTLCYAGRGSLRGDRNLPGYWCATSWSSGPITELFTEAYCGYSKPNLRAVCKSCSTTNGSECV